MYVQEREQLEAHPVQLTPGSEPTLAHSQRPSFARDAALQVKALSHDCAGSVSLCMRPETCGVHSRCSRPVLAEETADRHIIWSTLHVTLCMELQTSGVLCGSGEESP